MKLHIPCLFTIFSLFLPSAVVSQDSHVHSQYNKNIKATVVQTDSMFLVNSLSHFLQFELTSNLPGEHLTKPPKKITLMIWSSSPTILFTKDTDRKIRFNTDGERWTLSPTTYLLLKGEAKNGKEAFYSEKRPGHGYNIFIAANCTD